MLKDCLGHECYTTSKSNILNLQSHFDRKENTSPVNKEIWKIVLIGKQVKIIPIVSNHVFLSIEFRGWKRERKKHNKIKIVTVKITLQNERKPMHWVTVNQN